MTCAHPVQFHLRALSKVFPEERSHLHTVKARKYEGKKLHALIQTLTEMGGGVFVALLAAVTVMVN